MGDEYLGLQPPRNMGLELNLMEFFSMTGVEVHETFYSGIQYKMVVTPTQVADRLMAWPRPKE